MPRTALLPLEDAATTDAVMMPVGLGSGVKSCFLTEDGVGMAGWGLYGVGFGVCGDPVAVDVLGATAAGALVVAADVAELAALL